VYSCAVRWAGQAAKIKTEVEDKNKQIVDLETKVAEAKSTLKALQSGVGSKCRGDNEATSLGFQMNSKDSD
jgi:hypothetical protein